MTQQAGRRRWRDRGIAVFLGAAAALGLEPLSIWPATLAALIALPVLLAGSPAPRGAAALGWAFGLGYFMAGLAWLIEPFLVDIERYGWMAPFALVFMAGGLALFWALAFGLAARLRTGPFQHALLLTAAWSLAEFGRGYLFTGFPWAGFAQIWLDTPVAQLLSVTGPQGLGALTLLATLVPGAALTAGRARGLSLLPGAALALTAFVIAGARPGVAPTDQTVRLVQPNAAQNLKWDPEWMPVFFRRQMEFTAEGAPADLTVWPETAVPVWLDQPGDTLRRVAGAARGGKVVLGIRRGEGRRIYNSLAVLDEQGAPAGVYDKAHLVPFGEYVPFGDLLARFGIYGFAANAGQGFSAGPGARLIDLGAAGKALPLICYEAVFPQDVLAAPERPALLLQLTNDAWFGAAQGPYQHLAQARMRAIESGLPMIRAANTGVSAMIDPLGRITASVPLNTAGYVDAALPAPLPPTIFARTGEWPALAALVVLLAGAGFAGERRRRPIPD